MKKKFLAITMVLALCLSLCACGGSSDTKATIIDNEGNTVQMTAKELIALDDENSAKFDNLYQNAEITLVGTVESVDSGFRENGVSFLWDRITLEGGWQIQMYHGSHDEVLLELSAGDTVEITSKIKSTFGSCVNMFDVITSWDGTHDESAILLK